MLLAALGFLLSSARAVDLLSKLPSGRDLQAGSASVVAGACP